MNDGPWELPSLSIQQKFVTQYTAGV